MGGDRADMTGGSDGSRTAPATAMARRHRAVALVCASVAVAMVGLAYASVPLYRLFCQATGFAGTTQRAERPSAQVLERHVTVRFDANVGPGLSWDFGALQRTADVKIGENVLAFYKVTNRSEKPTVGTATFNVTPEQAGAYFNKIECFCFTEQRLEPGESLEMPVSFFIDPAIMKNPDARGIGDITLSYTFYPVDNPKKTATSGTGTPAVPTRNGS
jgi:cytochrome c oxidase assembly protein subunit 11